ncbi:hypothetical protein GQ54DRAFT_35286 [Martensiomyces pterosporus]|nr:hypothetical protein GQ54DRAFT_35286 [Martensiomyces pterosporus]
MQTTAAIASSPCSALFVAFCLCLLCLSTRHHSTHIHTRYWRLSPTPPLLLRSLSTRKDPSGRYIGTMGSAFIDDPAELARFTATTDSTLFPAAVSPINSLYRSNTGAQSETTGSDQVLVTAQGEGIQIYTTSDSKCLRSWPFPPSVRFACPAKYFRRADEEGKALDSYVYVALSSGEGISTKDQGAVVWRWTDKGIESVGLEDKIEARYTAPVFAIEPAATAAGHIVTIHTDGSLTLAAQDLAKAFSLSAPAPGKARTLWCQLVDVSLSMRSYLDSRQVAEWMGGDYRLAITLVSTPDPEIAGTEAYYVSLLVIDGAEANIAEVGTTRINPTYLHAQPLTCAFDADTGTLALLSETGVLSQLSLTVGSSALDDPVLLERSKEVALRGFMPRGRESRQNNLQAPGMLPLSQLALAALTEKYVVIAGTHSVVSHASKATHESVLTLWDLQYGCLHAEKPLAVSPQYLQSRAAGSHSPRLVYQVQTLNPRLNQSGTSSDQISVAVTVAHTDMPHSAFDSDTKVASASTAKKGKKSQAAANSSVAWSVETFVTSTFLPPVTLLASLRLQNNPKYYVDPDEQTSTPNVIHSSNILLHEEQEQGLGVLRSGWEAIVDGTAPASEGIGKKASAETFLKISKRRAATQQQENEVLLKLADVSDAVDSDQYTKLFMDHVGVSIAPETRISDDNPMWISAHLMTTVMRRCFAEPLGVSRTSQLPLFAPRVIEFMLANCGLANSHAPAPGLLPHLIARVDRKRSLVLTSDPAWGLVGVALRRCPDLPEKQAVEALRFQLSHYDAYVDRLFDLSPEADREMDDDVKRVAEDVSRTVSAIANIAGNDDVLRLALSQLPLTHVSCIIRLLIIWLQSWSALGANVELAASARFVSAATIARTHGFADDAAEEEADIAGPIRETIAEAGRNKTRSLDGVPAVDSSLTLFKIPRESAETKKPSATSLVRELTRDWAPALVLPSELLGAPELDRVVDLVSLLLDAHISNIMLSPDLHELIGELTKASNKALWISDQLKLLRIGLIPFNLAWEKQQEERAASDLAQQKRELGLDEVVLLNGMTRSQAERLENNAHPNAKVAQGTGSAGTYWERVQKLERYRVEVMHW